MKRFSLRMMLVLLVGGALLAGLTGAKRSTKSRSKTSKQTRQKTTRNKTQKKTSPSSTKKEKTTRKTKKKQKSKYARLKLLNLSPDAPSVDVSVDNVVKARNVRFNSTPKQLALEPGERKLKVTAASDADNVLLETSVTIGDAGAYHLVLMGAVADKSLKTALLEPDMKADKEMVKLRLVNTCPDAPAIDLVVKDGQTLFQNIRLGEGAPYVTLKPGKYVLEFRIPGQEGQEPEVLAATPSLSLERQGSYTLYAAGLAKGNTFTTHTVTDLAGRKPQPTKPAQPFKPVPAPTQTPDEATEGS